MCYIVHSSTAEATNDFTTPEGLLFALLDKQGVLKYIYHYYLGMTSKID